MEYIIGFVINFLNFFAIDNIMTAFFRSDKNNYRKLLLYISRFIILNVLFENIMNNVSVRKIFVTFVVTYIIFLHLYKTFKVAFAILVWDVISAAFEFFSFAFSYWVLDVTVLDIMTQAAYFTVFTVTYNFILYLASYIFKSWVKRNLDPDYVSVHEWILLSLFPIINYSVIYIMLYDSLSSGIVEKEPFLISLLLIFATVIFIYFMGEICKSNKTRQLMLIRQKDEEAQKEYISAVQTAYEKQRSITHDYNREIATLKSLLQLKDYSRLEKYLNKLVGNSQKNRLVVLTHNTIVDAILNQKYTEAGNIGIAMEFVLDNLSGLPVTDEDLVTILTNSLDNAISAAARSQDKIIQVFMSYEEDEFLCVVKNSVNEQVPIDNNNVVRKSEDIYHGFGIKNIRHAISRYDSHMTLECSDTRFILSLMISF